MCDTSWGRDQADASRASRFGGGFQRGISWQGSPDGPERDGMLLAPTAVLEK